MRMVDVIEKKRSGGELTKTEISDMIEQYTAGDIPDYQMSALAMAVFFQGMTTDERVHLTQAMAASGDQVDLSGIEGVKVDKHSTGGVGDTTTLILAPLAASVGVPVAKMSGRGLGHTGGTIDKLEAINGFDVELDGDTFNRLVNENKAAVTGQSGNLTPADKKLYGLRDVTATVDSIPLIASSIMSKKLASGADAVVLDVKTGTGAFMKETKEARELAQAMVDIGNGAGRHTTAVISDMNQPLGYAVGNALEVKEAVETLKGEGPDDIFELCLALGSHMVVAAGLTETTEEAEERLREAVRSGKALETMKTFIAGQGGDPAVADDPEKLSSASYKKEVTAAEDGYVASIAADDIGTAASMLGAGRTTKESTIDLAAGIMLHKKIGDMVQKGEVLAVMHSSTENTEEAEAKIMSSYTIETQQTKPPQLLYDVIH
ncbi:pyrimidine-nucleoside phosphorylase [Salibacterium qingdaonense]|uniref:Pyrimidine-nucleoside phosphorylase n=1 Tax=Salibacterium qingdaonense TaxID=266892 RepID=A0A1I4N049_9BACI|nr:pyrimidine-nucleoside phosphorylase [Salibacterium qingdaonense]SFM08901.1 pyrimidine-nucleoside phosphorylase [Salibacterium qingdaonense]